MARLIDADKLISSIETFIDQCVKNYSKMGISLTYTRAVMEFIKKSLDRAPTVDAVPVVHGALGSEYIDEYYGPFADCKLCGADNILPCNYCRKCGAKMDGGNPDGKT